MKSAYLAGPMRNLPNFGFQRFEDAKNHLQQLLVIRSPHDMDIADQNVDIVSHVDGTDDGYRRVFDSVTLKPTFNEQEVLRKDFLVLLNCDYLVLLEGWEASSGATKERQVAEWAGITIFELVNGNLLLQD